MSTAMTPRHMDTLRVRSGMTGERILYIEDNSENRLLVRRVLMAEGYALLEAVDGPAGRRPAGGDPPGPVLLAEGYALLEAVDGPAGLRLAEENPPDLILMDINLPELDGYQVTSRIILVPRLAHIPIIAVTANVMKGDRERS